jgi:hypothetical protein
VYPTNDAIKKQIEAMTSDVFELGLFRLPDSTGRQGGGMIPREWDQDTLLRSVSWLRFENMNGRNIYIRPKGEHPLSLVDDLSRSGIEQMKSEGFQPAAIVETSPRNFQAWMNHGERLPRDLSTAVARALAKRFGGDTHAADWRHFGRLAGFTNQKEKHRQPNGLFPYVRLIESAGMVYSRANEFVGEVREIHRRESLARKFRVTTYAYPATAPRKTIEDFRQNSMYGGDGTRIDLAYAIYALSHGVGANELRAVIRSRDLSHKGSERRQDDYVERTIRKALALQRAPSIGR